ncbi:MAG: XRE family transcriptional regulator [Calditrichaeota bacterium]|nr:MAG: XRE family transcriptional regulator [Calditrichota bacterium]MBL1204845.1 XRE family transcriptional regulator [Calditrichota bacterium]NOG44674.1 helix-turn-helix transcriptional regulator [Calditrichota bacterium]
MNSFGETVRFHRKKCGLSQLQLANLAGIGKTTVFDIEKNRHTFQTDTIQKVCDALNLKMNVQSPFTKNRRV